MRTISVLLPGQTSHMEDAHADRPLNGGTADHTPAHDELQETPHENGSKCVVILPRVAPSRCSLHSSRRLRASQGVASEFATRQTRISEGSSQAPRYYVCKIGRAHV